MKTLIMKFGGSSVDLPEKFLQVADLVIERKKRYKNVVVVISAMGKMTDELFFLAKKVHKKPPARELDMLLSVGERISISLLAMALRKKGAKAISFTGSQSGIITCDRHSGAKIVDVKPRRILEQLEKGKVVIVAGFQGVSKKAEITTLGRGGSDTSAVALAIALKASKVEFFKDVDGFYNSDPKVNPQATLLPKLSFEKAIKFAENGAKVLHARCIRLAKKNQIALHLLSHQTKKAIGSVIGKTTNRVKTPIYEEETHGS